jgi:NhaC family Na+:H+ antiporter
MTLTTIPTYIITLILFVILGLSVEIKGDVNIATLLREIMNVIYRLRLFIVPAVVDGFNYKKPLIALSFSRYFHLLLFCLIFPA